MKLNKYYKERAEKIKSLYQSGQTLQKIGSNYGLTRERIRQILKSYFNITNLKSIYPQAIRRRLLIKKNCAYCIKEILTHKPGLKFCNRDCYQKSKPARLSKEEVRLRSNNCAKRYYQKNRDMIIAKSKLPKNRKKFKQYSKLYYQKNKEQLLAKCKAHYQNNPEKYRAYFRKYYLEKRKTAH